MEPTTGHENYLRVREHVLGMIGKQEALNAKALPSRYWSEELAGFDYMLEASPLLVKKLRHHTFHLTGLKTYDYRSSQTKRKEAFSAKLAELRKADAKGLFVPESPILGGFGHEIEGGLVNIDTLKFYESLIALDKGGVLETLQKTEKPVVAEVGAGWGGFAYQLKHHVPNMTYVIIDFPEVFLFSAVYLLTAFPGSRALFVEDEASLKEFDENLKSYDFVFMPQERFQEIWNLPLDLAVNMVSFQEMTSAQVDGYARKFWENGAKNIYSHNRDRSGHNTELSLVSEILGKYYDLQRVHVVDGPYTDLNAKFREKKEKKKVKAAPSQWRLAARLVKNTLFALRHQDQELPGNKKPKDNSYLEYRHLLGSPLKSPRNED